MKNHISSTEFATLCQSQISLLSQGLGAVWSVIYLTENTSEEGQGQLFPFAIHPQGGNQSFWQLPPLKLSEIWQLSHGNFVAQLLPKHLASQSQERQSSTRQIESAETKQLILPLIHQETFIGLLVTGREDREWNSDELQQAEAIARTISLARFIEFQYHWAQDELTVQENLRRIEHDRLDNLLHQLKNPLTALRTFGKLLLKRLLPNDPNGKLAESILAQSDRFQALLEQFEAESHQLPQVSSVNQSPPLLADSQSDIDQSSFLLPSSATKLEPVDLKLILAPLLNISQAIAIERGIKLVNQIPDSLPLVLGDLAALREILNNLLDNALKYTASGGKVQLELASRDRRLGIIIRDTGVGIPPSVQARIFERHYRGVQAQGDIPGTGLGLAIAKELAVKMQGEIELISPNNFTADSIGTTFILWLVSMDNEQWTIDN
ncbi:MAG: sensor histidine kinase [Cyanobacteria bacterium J06631_2]